MEDTDKYMLIHGYTGAIDIVSQNIISFLKNTHYGFTEEECPLSTKTITALEKRGYITNKTQEEEYAHVERLAEALHRKEKILNTAFTFAITYNCNFRCPYCYEAELHSGSTSIAFTKEMADKAYHAIMEIEPREQLRAKNITLYGGEPLLKENKKVVEYIVFKGKKLGFKFNAITNGYDLDTYEELLSPELINHVQITIDGMKELHNSKRIHCKGHETFNKIVSNIGIALKRGTGVTIRVNTDRNNFDDLIGLDTLFNKLGYSKYKNFKINSALLRDYDKEGKYNSSTIPSELFSQKEFMEKHKQLNFNYGCQDYGTFYKIHSAIFNHNPLVFSPIFCKAQSNSYVFDPFGKIYPCWEVVGKTDSQIGDYNRDKIYWNSEIIEHWRKYNTNSSLMCKNCKYALLCRGGCPAHSFINSTQCNQFSAIINYSANRAFRKVNNI
ncbi:radical SAM/SPASM domain-containing protein [Bacteroides sp. GM023]|uniref:radical SAM/SPASM domain-containing protein n=1 Tax=Bacteroides sp. GM023 TaxID=2723058 RepID=UPI001CC283FD|nr:SPASM domain-containing protein [Bacteroides sp. GM023]